MIGIGNHEYDHTIGGEHDPSHAEGPGGFRLSWFNSGDNSGGECRVPMYYRFKMPDTGHSIWWYVFVCLFHVHCKYLAYVLHIRYNSSTSRFTAFCNYWLKSTGIIEFCLILLKIYG